MQDERLAWCRSVLGPCERLGDDERIHGRASVLGVQTPTERFYAKFYTDPSDWVREVHGYEQWAQGFGCATPHLVAVSSSDPLAILVTALPGTTARDADLGFAARLDVWRHAGQALLPFHAQAQGEFFGPCRRDGSPEGEYVTDGADYVEREFVRLEREAAEAGLLNGDEAALVVKARRRVSVFADEPPVPCHRDYGPDNWLVLPQQGLTGVIDFEFSAWDVRAVEFSRYPHWEWIDQPSLVDALLSGYGWQHPPAHWPAQLGVLRVQYALGAVVWGTANSFFGFAAEGHRALALLQIAF